MSAHNFVKNTFSVTALFRIKQKSLLHLTSLILLELILKSKGWNSNWKSEKVEPVTHKAYSYE